MWKTQAQEARVKSIIIMVGAVLACTAPFLHMLMPHESAEMLTLKKQLELNEVSRADYDVQYPILKEKQEFFGFSSPRRFWYAIGMPIMIFFFSLLFLSVSNLLVDENIRKAIIFACTISLFIGVYFIIYVLWPGQDIPAKVYYVCLVLMSVVATVLGYYIARHRWSLTMKIRRLVRFISIEAFGKYVQKEDQVEYLDDSFEAYEDMLK